MPEIKDVDVNAEIKPARLRIEDKDKLRQVSISRVVNLFFDSTIMHHDFKIPEKKRDNFLNLLTPLTFTNLNEKSLIKPK